MELKCFDVDTNVSKGGANQQKSITTFQVHRLNRVGSFDRAQDDVAVTGSLPGEAHALLASPPLSHAATSGYGICSPTDVQTAIDLLRLFLEHAPEGDYRERS